MQQYLDLVRHVLEEGTLKENRTGVTTIGVFGYHYKHKLSDGFPLLTTKTMKWEHIVLENLWFLSGTDKADFLRHYNIKFWEPWTDNEGVVANCYGPAWMKFPTQPTGSNNQIEFAIRELRNNPLSRRIVISAWDPNVAQTAPLPPCHVTWVLNTQIDRQGDLCLNLALFQRSCDIMLGVPYNLAGYSFLLHLMAHLTNLKVGEFSHTLVDAHIYTNHLEGASLQLKRTPKPLPVLSISSDIKQLSDIETIIANKPALSSILEVFKLSNYKAHPAIPLPVAV